jgi:hypothetical protein
LADEPNTHLVLLCAEVIALAIALALGFLRLGQAHSRWIDARFRAEMLRREGWLLATSSGCYQAAAPAHVARLASLRVARLTAPEIPIAMLLTGDPHDESPLTPAPVSTAAKPDVDLATLVRRYRTERVEAQLAYLRSVGSQHARSARRWEGSARLVLVLALALAAFRVGAGLTGKSSDALYAVDFLALLLPAIGSTLVSLHSLMGSHRLSRSYRYTASLLAPSVERLDHIETLLSTSESRVEVTGWFRREVGRTEAILGQDLLRWHLAMEPEVPRAAA